MCFWDGILVCVMQAPDITFRRESVVGWVLCGCGAACRALPPVVLCPKAWLSCLGCITCQFCALSLLIVILPFVPVPCAPVLCVPVLCASVLFFRAVL